MSTPQVPPAAPALSQGLEIEYKAFARSFFQTEKAGVLYLMATCYYKTSGFTIFFEQDASSGKFKLMEQPPTGIFLNLTTYYVANWPPTGVSAETDVLPKQVTIADAYGEHQVRVKPWK